MRSMAPLVAGGCLNRAQLSSEFPSRRGHAHGLRELPGVGGAPAREPAVVGRHVH